MGSFERFGEIDFDPREMFFSRTDERGVIKAGNNFFREISGYEWDELIEKPHKVLRHPDVPKAIFYYFWQEIRAKRPIGAFVKNKCKDGSYYWVFGLALPISDSYISIRIKPTSEKFNFIFSIYEELVVIEKASSQEESLKILVQRLNENGFENYQSFMTQVLIQELQSRNNLIQGKNAKAYGEMISLLQNRIDLKEGVQKIFSYHDDNKWASLNLDILSSHLDTSVKTFTVVSQKYQELVEEIKIHMKHFEEEALKVDENLFGCLFLVSANFLVKEIVSKFKENKEVEYCDVEKEFEYFGPLERKYENEALDSISVINGLILSFSRISQKLRNHLIALDLIRLSGRIELNRIGGDSDVKNILDQLQLFQEQVSGELKLIEMITFEIESSMKNLIRENKII
ncbi:PAS domain protein [Bacteriovorax sp. BSW11_IV]|uniref:PAS domain-containing protein n=1 Tax=Bacteriovorax sp. BSW11_IV TaxID=1353529 RepID=UPI000389FAA5|nr:PAS domain-containing protein [Bacteriovorax sp. BSW11_IV]EQC48293.1 PAS domain protein [Bacteriovorax sp. BSW11_IV]